MDDLNIISLIITLIISLILGFLTILLSAFAIWLSIHFNRISNDALNSVKKLSTETRSLVDMSVSQQKDFSSKMLDSILEYNRYGYSIKDENVEKSGVYKAVIQREIDKIENRITDSIEKKAKELIKDEKNGIVDMKNILTLVRKEIKGLTDDAISISSPITLPSDMKNKLLARQKFPAFYLLIAAIIKENINNIEGLNEVAKKYNLPNGFEAALQDLIDLDILEGSKEKFNVKSLYRVPFAVWIDNNWENINGLIKFYSNSKDARVSKEEMQIAQRFKF